LRETDERSLCSSHSTLSYVSLPHLDGELCAVRPDGATSFSALQAAAGLSTDLVYFAFDLLHLDGEALTRRPLLDRKALLEALLKDTPLSVRFSEHVIGNGPAMLREACKLGAEGIVSKQIGKPYLPGNRGAWVKTKILNRQEFVVVGWTDPEGSRSSIGSLLLGYYRDDGKLIYAGRVGTGMTETELRALLEKLRPLAADRMTVDVPRRRRRALVGRLNWRACIGCNQRLSPK
jgi:bifunctional non-homologous end joining protein LigD